MSAILVGLLAVALADETAPAATVPLPTVDGVPVLRVRRQARRTYPRPLFDDLSVEHRCTYEVAIDARGRPFDLRPTDCPDDLVDWTARRVKRDRWVRPVPEGARAEVEVIYVPPSDAGKLPNPDYWRRREHGACELRVVVEQDGHAWVKVADPEGDPSCAPVVRDVAPVPESALTRKSPTVCPVTFLLAKGRPVEVELFRCEVPTWRPVRDALAAWTWPDADGPLPYTIQLELRRDGASAP